MVTLSTPRSIFRKMASFSFAAPLPVAAQDAPVAAPGVFDLLLPLVLVLIAGAAAWWLVRRRGSLLRSDGPMQLVQVLPVGPRERLLLLRLGRRHWICGATPTQVSLIAALDDVPPENTADR